MVIVKRVLTPVPAIGRESARGVLVAVRDGRVSTGRFVLVTEQVDSRSQQEERVDREQQPREVALLEASADRLSGSGHRRGGTIRG